MATASQLQQLYVAYFGRAADPSGIDYWVAKGAQMSDRVKLLKKYSLDPDNLEKRQKIKSAQLQKLSEKKTS